jgi:phosphatidate cytidylyltransferase
MAAARGAGVAPRSDLATRAAVGLLLAALALGALWAGGAAFALLVAAAVLLVLAEWAAMHGIPRAQLAFGSLLLAGVCLIAFLGRPQEALLLLFVGVGVSLVFGVTFAPRARGFLFSGLLYAGLPAVALLWLRGLEQGFALVLWTMGIVWATDIAAYFAGRAIGGPRLAPRISPNKTWAGLGGGVAAAALFAGSAGWALGWAAPPLMLALAGAGLALVAQAGDLAESHWKRRAGIKDSGRLLPGHGGVMDRVDGLVPAAVAVALAVAILGAPA